VTFVRPRNEDKSTCVSDCLLFEDI